VGFRDGTEVVRADNVLIDPSDCGLDDVTYGVRGELPPEVDIDSLVIEGVDPWVAPVLGKCCGRALLKYTVEFQPVDAIVVSCAPSPVLRDSGYVHCVAPAGATNGPVSEWRPGPDLMPIVGVNTSLQWAGPQQRQVS
jgi:hypothetical protein